MIKTVTVSPLVRVNQWAIRVSISNSENIMVMAFGKSQEEFQIKFFKDPETARLYIETLSGPSKRTLEDYIPK